MSTICSARNFLLWLRAQLFLAMPVILFLLATRNLSAGDGSHTPDRILGRPDTICVSNYRSDTVEVFTVRGANLGVYARLPDPIGLAFDTAGNLYVTSDDPSGYSIQKFAPDGSVSTFATNDLDAPHALAFDTGGNLYVVNAKSNTILKFAPDGTDTVFADAEDGLVHPLDLVFDAAGNLFVSNAFGGPTRSGSIVKFTPDGVGSVFADSGFQLAYGLALDVAGNLYVSNFRSSTIEKFAPDGTDLGLFASAGLDLPHGMIFDRVGNLYVANNGNATIEKLSPTGADLGPLATTDLGPHFLATLRHSQMHVKGTVNKSGSRSKNTRPHCAPSAKRGTERRPADLD